MKRWALLFFAATRYDGHVASEGYNLSSSVFSSWLCILLIIIMTFLRFTDASTNLMEYLALLFSIGDLDGNDGDE